MNANQTNSVAANFTSEGKLCESADSLVLAQRIGHIGSWEVDVQRDTLRWSAETYRIFGRIPGEFVPTNEAFFASILPEDRAAVLAASKTSLENGHPFRVEHRICRTDGAVRFVCEQAEMIRDADGRVERMVGTVQDITEQREAEAALAQERNLLRTLLDNLPDCIYVKDAQSRYLAHNAADRRLLGLKSDNEGLGKTVFDFFPHDIAERYSADDQKVIQTGESVVNREEPYTNAAGQSGWLLTTKLPLRDPQGKIVGLVGISRDVTQQKAADTDRLNMERKLLDAQKLESLGVLAGGIAHDFNNLLTGILGFASLTRLELPSHAPQQAYVEKIEQTAKRAADLCKQMLAYAGKGKFQTQRVDISGLVEETTHLIKSSINKKAELQFDLPKGLPSVSADPTELRQVVMNLVINASEAIGEKPGVIRVAAGFMNASREYLSALHLAPEMPEGGYVYLEVADTGCGMTPETQSRIFDPFFTTKFAGRGLGLAAVLGIVRSHKGAMKLDSAPSRGTCFRILLPAAIGPAESTTTPVTATDGWQGFGTVIVAEDEDGVRLVATRVLQRMGFKVRVAADGVEAIALFQQGIDQMNLFTDPSEEIVAVLSDLTMPRADGEQVLREVRRVRPSLPVVLMSGYTEYEADKRFAGLGLTGFLQKPFRPEELRARMQQVLPARPSKG